MTSVIFFAAMLVLVEPQSEQTTPPEPPLT